ncbi:uncharacterized protein Z519_01560 [Cladophialophora bantiana CBS 173.52]|uniref:NACHT-NTPase and P-loop NTPases N-terminal domain-containing protein n=1 Tax=Cladophialophora bantiana (strain ATCC 10958 / CBS 173.52 / CDC B-1940 / NIH 8579) TaxID=1442370 RepID=A0A0D2F7C2_CLAB1|nr:uncharacterized protein Z519_01560 [Cladophialophora bantiana CBS 173.52]KIW97976.1 hypothetical protein Z519_01560 [Cladophialophora bantiana CBS 173.52]
MTLKPSTPERTKVFDRRAINRKIQREMGQDYTSAVDYCLQQGITPDQVGMVEPQRFQLHVVEPTNLQEPSLIPSLCPHFQRYTAEAVLGVVAGGAGLASLAVQLLECIQKLHNLHANIRDAPIEIREILDEVDLLDNVLTSYHSLPGADFEACLAPTLVQKQALGYCFKVLEILRNIACELETTMQKFKFKAMDKLG